MLCGTIDQPNKIFSFDCPENASGDQIFMEDNDKTDRATLSFAEIEIFGTLRSMQGKINPFLDRVMV